MYCTEVIPIAGPVCAISGLRGRSRAPQPARSPEHPTLTKQRRPLKAPSALLDAACRIQCPVSGKIVDRTARDPWKWLIEIALDTLIERRDQP